MDGAIDPLAGPVSRQSAGQPFTARTASSAPSSERCSTAWSPPSAPAAAAKTKLEQWKDLRKEQVKILQQIEKDKVWPGILYRILVYTPGKEVIECLLAIHHLKFRFFSK